jgi:hypothetical protein
MSGINILFEVPNEFCIYIKHIIIEEMVVEVVKVDFKLGTVEKMYYIIDEYREHYDGDEYIIFSVHLKLETLTVYKKKEKIHLQYNGNKNWRISLVQNF